VIYADQRWIGSHGIGRFARHVLGSLQYQPVELTSSPAAPLDTWLLSRALRQLEHTDLFFSPGYNTPVFCAARLVFTIHDLTHIHCPESRRPQVQLYYATVMKRACRRAARIITVSEFTRKQIIGWSGVAPEKVVNVGNGIESTYHPQGDSYAPGFSYLLSVSNRKPHKNEFRIVEAFAKADLDPRMRLVFTGETTEKLSHWIDIQQVRSRVEFMGNVPEESLPALYRGAQALIFPSLYEGFGLPILEAMACGTPVVTSNLTAMPETAGFAAVFVNPRSVEEIANAMERIIGDSSLRNQMRDRGIVRASEFSWEATCLRVAQQLREVVV
jgi:glycosyltransferase involved in cell wall biosynthesis